MRGEQISEPNLFAVERKKNLFCAANENPVKRLYLYRKEEIIKKNRTIVHRHEKKPCIKSLTYSVERSSYQIEFICNVQFIKISIYLSLQFNRIVNVTAATDLCLLLANT